MRTFTDNAGRSWTLAINVDTIRRVRSLVDFDLLQAVEGTHVATLLRARIQTSFTDTPATITVTPVVAFNGSLPSGDLTVQNIYKWHSGLVNKAFLIIWNPVDEQWEPVQMECP